VGIDLVAHEGGNAAGRFADTLPDPAAMRGVAVAMNA
jgi:hypothetical protein